MGFMDWMEEQNKKAQASQLKLQANASANFEGIKLGGGEIRFNGTTHDVVGAHAEVEVGGTQRRTTATRVVVGSVLTFGVGTAIGAMAKKKTNNVYLSIELADGQLIVVEVKSKKESEARKFAATVNQAAVVNAKLRAESEATAELEPAAPAISSPPPPPPSVPEGWYRDPDGRPVQRYWNGTAWTDDTAPLPPS